MTEEFEFDMSSLTDDERIEFKRLVRKMGYELVYVGTKISVPILSARFSEETIKELNSK